MINKFDHQKYTQELANIGYPESETAVLGKLLSAAQIQPTPASRSIPAIFRSSKMEGRMMPFGSKLEYAFGHQLEVDPNVSGYLWGTTDFPITWRDADGTVRSVRHMPDGILFLAAASGLTPNVPFLRCIEVKCAESLEKAYNAGSRRYIPEADGRWTCPSASLAAKKLLNADYVVLLDSAVNPNVPRNFEFLHAFNRLSAKAVPIDVCEATRESVSRTPGIGLPGLLSTVPGLTPDRFFKLLVDGSVFVRLEHCRLDLLNDVQVFLDRATADFFTELNRPASDHNHCTGRYPMLVPNEKLVINGLQFTVSLKCRDIIVLKDEHGKSVELTIECLSRLQRERQVTSLGVLADKQQRASEILAKTSPEKLLAATERYEPLKPWVENYHGAIPRKRPPLSPRQRYWLPKARAAYAETGMGVLGCIDLIDKRGSRAPRVAPICEKVITEVILEDYAQPQAPSVVSTYAKYQRRCRDEAIAPVSKKTFRKRIKRYKKAFLANRREGAMAGAALEAPVDRETLLEGGGRWYFHLAHMDEFVLDLASIGLGQCWVVVMLDSYTRTVLAVVVTFESPSYYTTMLTLRECVRRHGRLPEILMTDSGPGFKNLSLRLLLAYFGVVHMRRPKGKARWGAEIERLGGATNQRIADELPGATKVLQKHRRVSQTHDPAGFAAYALSDIGQLLREWYYNVYDKLPHAGLFGKTPEGTREISKAEHGTREHLQISDDPNFWTLSLPAVAGDGTAKVQHHDGVQVGNIYYWHERFDYPEVIRTRVPVRWDPLNISYVWAFVKGDWVKCFSLKLASLRNLAPEFLATVSLALRKGRQDYARNYNNVLSRVRDFVDSWRRSPDNGVEFARMMESVREALRNGYNGLTDDDTNQPDAPKPTSPPTRPVPGTPQASASPVSEFADLETGR